MAITGRFIADFSDFQRAVQQAEVSLRSFETGSARVETSLNRMVDSFSGRRVIQDAQLMTDAVERIGGVSRLTESELRRVSATAQEAADKMTRMGIDVPPGIQQIATAAERVGPSLRSMGDSADASGGKFRGLRDGLAAVDKTLGAGGINVGPAIRVLDELGTAATVGAAGLGKLGSAFAVVGVAAAAVSFGRMIADWGDLDRRIGEATARLMGWGDVAEQTAGVRSDMLARASSIAGREITNLGEALRITQEDAKRYAENAAAAAEQNKQLAASAEQARDKFIQQWQEGINERIAARKAAIEAYNESVRRMNDAHAATVASRASEAFGHDAIANARVWIEALGDVARVSEMSADQQRRLAEDMRLGTEAMIRAGNATDAMTSTMEAFRIEATKGAREATAAFDQIQKEAAEAARAVAAMNDTMSIIGPDLQPGMGELERPQSLLRPQSLSQRGTVIYGATGARTEYAGYQPAYEPPPSARSSGPTVNVNVGNFIGGDRAGADALGRMAWDSFQRKAGRLPSA